ncbi:hypothetical protein [Cyanobacterium aponinum]|uniref:hypothetical protein n=1 Tax=Cyanobacterium aponinum TaxID=379064 RepID=UPI000C129F36|nr:hypothetical protein [Cyanobacterium aponinum]PHV64317.1 hypothetical protein CSQ80_00405 [Cyanobacterium aponinum IPPAS B-1201]
MNIKEQINAEIEQLNDEQLQEIYQLAKKLKKSPISPKKHLPRCAGIGNSGLGNLSERDEELLWQKD